MSYDIDLYVVVDGQRVSCVEVGNQTYNVEPILSKYLPYSFSKLNGRIAEQVIDDIYEAVTALLNPKNRKELEALEPANGWGSLKGATSYMVALQDACNEFPSALIRID